MNFIELVVAALKYRDNKEAPVSSYAGDGVLLVTDKKIITYMRDEDLIVGDDIKQVKLPDDFSDADEYNHLMGAFLDPDGEAVDGRFAYEVGGDVERRMLSVLPKIIEDIKTDKQALPDSVVKMFITGRQFSLMKDESGAAIVKSGLAKKYKKIDNLRLGELVDKNTELVNLALALKHLVKKLPEDHVVMYSEALRAVNVMYTIDGVHYGVIISFIKRDIEKEQTMPAKVGEDVLNSIIAETKEPLNATQETPVAPAVVAEPVVEAVEVTEVPVEVESTPVAAETSVSTEEVAQPTAPAVEPEVPAVVPMTDEEKLAELNETMDLKACQGNMRNTINHMVKVIQTQARIIKKGSTSAAAKEQLTAVKAELAEAKKQNKELLAARKKMLDALGLSV